MFCMNCGKELDNNSMFCKYCGTQINGGVEGLNEISQVEEKEFLFPTYKTRSNEVIVNVVNQWLWNMNIELVDIKMTPDQVGFIKVEAAPSRIVIRYRRKNTLFRYQLFAFCECMWELNWKAEKKIFEGRDMFLNSHPELKKITDMMLTYRHGATYYTLYLVTTCHI